MKRGKPPWKNPRFCISVGIDWAIDNMAIIDLKKRQMTFEDNQIRVIAPLDPLQGPHYIEPIRAEEEVRNMQSLY